jgi:hypothetical protein
MGIHAEDFFKVATRDRRVLLAHYYQQQVFMAQLCGVL